MNDEEDKDEKNNQRIVDERGVSVYILLYQHFTFLFIIRTMLFFIYSLAKVILIKTIYDHVYF